MATLEDTDRVAVLLRYFENKSLREVGQTLGTNEDAAEVSKVTKSAGSRRAPGSQDELEGQRAFGFSNSSSGGSDLARTGRQLRRPVGLCHGPCRFQREPIPIHNRSTLGVEGEKRGFPITARDLRPLTITK
jgi:hypothetical protein